MICYESSLKKAMIDVFPSGNRISVQDLNGSVWKSLSLEEIKNNSTFLICDGCTTDSSKCLAKQLASRVKRA